MKIPLFLLLGLVSLQAATLTVTSPNGTVEANYSTTHLFIDEIAGDSIPITIFFDPTTSGVQTAEVYTNLNRREQAGLDANNDGIEDGILPPSGDALVAGNDSNYYKAYTMSLVSGGYQITINANKTGAYRLTARYRTNINGPWIYYNSTDGGGKRDHALVISPKSARDIRLYEVNTLNIEASGTLFSQRSTFEDLSDRPGAIHTANGRPNNWNLSYMNSLGINWLWFQPYHPYGWEGRHLNAQNINDRAPGTGATTRLWNGGFPSEDVNFPYALGSPYAVKNFWEIEPRMSSAFVGDPNNISDVSSQVNRNAAMTSFQNFVTDADTAGVNIMPDAAFNHTAWDVELGDAGIATASGNPNVSWMAAQGASGWQKTDLIHDRELRVFSRLGDYRLRANFYTSFFNNNIAPAPDRTDFGKFLDVCEIFFGRYAALVGAQNGSEVNNFNSEGDWIDYTPTTWNGSSGGSFDTFTSASWRYFAQYAPYWLGKTRPANQNRNSTNGDGNVAQRYAWDNRGIDGLRCDFGQGLPPQAWEYIINVARSYKWNFVFMAETLDDGAPAYRSNRQFDILNETTFRGLRNATTAQSYKDLFDGKRTAFGQGLVLMNTVSHDEDNFGDPWDAVVRYAVSSSQDGVPMIFPGQELGISTLFGYDMMEKNFGKYIPHFKTYNSMMPLWTNLDFGNDQLFAVYSGINAARTFSPALRSSNRYFLNGDGGNNQIFSVGKYAEPGASPVTSDAVLAFANLSRAGNQSDNFKIPSALSNLLGLKNGRTYNVRNIAAYLRPPAVTGRRDAFLWGAGYTRSFLENTGFLVAMKRVPTTVGAWDTDPYEAQYLKLYDITAPTTAPSTPVAPNPFAYEIGNTVQFTWSPVSPDSEGVVPSYRVNIIVNGSSVSTFVTSQTSYTYTGQLGQSVSITVQAINPDQPANAGPASASSGNISLISATGDQDGDSMTNEAEKEADTNPLDANSILRITSITSPTLTSQTITWASVVDKKYQIEAATDLTAFPAFQPISGEITATTTSTSYTDPSASAARKFYRVRLNPQILVD